MQPSDLRLTAVTPSPRQLAFQQTEFYAFIHFTVNTFTGREWGDCSEAPSIFTAIQLDAAQWVEAVKSAGMRGLILTCKHHDGFCLWPSRFTGHTVAASPFRGGKSDVVREAAAACQAAGLKFGVYLSPWDRNQPCYGSGKEYDDYFVNQLTELLTGYGEIFSVWLDGACGEGPNGRRQVYDWERYYAKIRELQPGACINVCGPDIRWCGNEAGSTRESEWSVVPARTRDTEKIAENSQQADDGKFRLLEIKASDRNLGSRAFAVNLVDGAQLSASGCQPGYGIENVRVDSYAAWFRAPDAACEITVRFLQDQEVSYVVLKENIMDSQRIERFFLRDESGKLLYNGTVVGYKKIVPLAGKPRLRVLRICIEDSRVYPTLSFLGVY